MESAASARLDDQLDATTEVDHRAHDHRGGLACPQLLRIAAGHAHGRAVLRVQVGDRPRCRPRAPPARGCGRCPDRGRRSSRVSGASRPAPAGCSARGRPGCVPVHRLAGPGREYQNAGRCRRRGAADAVALLVRPPRSFLRSVARMVSPSWSPAGAAAAGCEFLRRRPPGPPHPSPSGRPSRRRGSRSPRPAGGASRIGGLQRFGDRCLRHRLAPGAAGFGRGRFVGHGRAVSAMCRGAATEVTRLPESLTAEHHGAGSHRAGLDR